MVELTLILYIGQQLFHTMNIELKNPEILTKVVKPMPTAGRIYVPKSWVGKKVILIIERHEEESKK